MATSLRSGISSFVLFFLGSFAVHGGDITPPLSTIIQGVIARDDATQKALQSLQYHQTLKSEQFDASGKVIKQQKVEMIIRPGDSNEIHVVAEEGSDMPGNPDDAKLQAEGKKAQKQKPNFPLKDLVSRFNINLVGTGTIQHQSVYILSFEPKADQPFQNQTERVLNHLHGRIQVCTRDYTILQTDATLAEPVEVAWIFASVSALTFHYELNNTTGGYAPAEISTFVRLDAPLMVIRQRMQVDITQMESRTSVAADSAHQ